MLIFVVLRQHGSQKASIVDAALLLHSRTKFLFGWDEEHLPLKGTLLYLLLFAFRFVSEIVSSCAIMINRVLFYIRMAILLLRSLRVLSLKLFGISFLERNGSSHKTLFIRIWTISLESHLCKDYIHAGYFVYLTSSMGVPR